MHRCMYILLGTYGDVSNPIQNQSNLIIRLYKSCPANQTGFRSKNLKLQLEMWANRHCVKNLF